MQHNLKVKQNKNVANTHQIEVEKIYKFIYGHGSLEK